MDLKKPVWTVLTQSAFGVNTLVTGNHSTASTCPAEALRIMYVEVEFMQTKRHGS